MKTDINGSFEFDKDLLIRNDEGLTVINTGSFSRITLNSTRDTAVSHNILETVSSKTTGAVEDGYSLFRLGNYAHDGDVCIPGGHDRWAFGFPQRGMVA